MKTKRAAIYTRVSTDAQTTRNQLRELKAAAKRHNWNVVAVFEDQGISGAKGREQRPAFDAMLKAAMRREFEVIAAWSVDRLGRSLLDLLNFLNEIHAKQIDLYLHQQGVDTGTPGGKALFQMCGLFAEFERSLIVERVRAGIARAREHGTKSGKPIGRARGSEATDADVLKLRAQRDASGRPRGILSIAKALNLGTGTVQRIVIAAESAASGARHARRSEHSERRRVSAKTA
jgi:DNA invertase Pin-like site-specific DNA recombinase